MRRGFVFFHRWAGLTLVLFLTVAGLTGSLLAWTEPLERAVSPSLFSSAGKGPALDPLALRERVAAAYPDADVVLVDLDRREGLNGQFFIAAKPGKAAPPDDQIFVDPATGSIVGARRWGDITQGMKNLIPFLYRLHYSLALGVVGNYLFGAAALLWTLDCFVGFGLTLPRFHLQSWWSRWGAAWRVRWRGGGYKINFDLHRAGGLWFWALLFVFAWSGVAFNLGEVYVPVTRAVFGYQDAYDSLPDRRDAPAPRLDWREAYAEGRLAMASAAQKEGFEILHETRLAYDSAKHVYMYRVKSSLDIGRGGGTSVYLDADDGRPLAWDMPNGPEAGNTLTNWLSALHTADVFGMPYRILTSIVGMVVTILSVTGLVIWLRKRSARKPRERIRSASSQ